MMIHHNAQTSLPTESRELLLIFGACQARNVDFHVSSLSIKMQLNRSSFDTVASSLSLSRWWLEIIQPRLYMTSNRCLHHQSCVPMPLFSYSSPAFPLYSLPTLRESVCNQQQQAAASRLSSFIRHKLSTGNPCNPSISLSVSLVDKSNKKYLFPVNSQ